MFQSRQIQDDGILRSQFQHQEPLHKRQALSSFSLYYVLLSNSKRINWQRILKIMTRQDKKLNKNQNSVESS